jgi:hypothetical protein
LTLFKESVIIKYVKFFKGVKKMNSFKRPYSNFWAVELETRNKKLLSFLLGNKRIEIINLNYVDYKKTFKINYVKLDK